jgi:hypothetical protein
MELWGERGVLLELLGKRLQWSVRRRLLNNASTQDESWDHFQRSPSREHQRDAKDEGVEARGEGEWIPCWGLRKTV